LIDENTYFSYIIALFFLTLKAQEKSKDTLFFSINKYYTVSPTLVSNLSDRTYTESIEFGKSKRNVRKQMVIFFVGDGF
jgi:hypothetical protein